MVKHNMRYWKRRYKECIKNKDYDFIDMFIMSEIWNIEAVKKAYIRYALDQGYKDPLQADEQYGLSIRWAHEVLFNEGR